MSLFLPCLVLSIPVEIGGASRLIFGIKLAEADKESAFGGGIDRSTGHDGWTTEGAVGTGVSHRTICPFTDATGFSLVEIRVAVVAIRSRNRAGHFHLIQSAG